jgi:hypothetical protein
MKTYSNDPQDYTLEDAYSEEFDGMSFQNLLDDMVAYLKEDGQALDSFEQALDSFKEWWIEKKIKEHGSDEDDYIADMAWHDYQNGD